jgi:uncharacterized protein YhbP (UPF0306 family)
MPTPTNLNNNPEEALALLKAHRTMTLATVSAGQPSAASLYFACDDNFRLYFVSDPATRHCRELAEKSAVAVTVNGDRSGWRELRGLQIRGRVHQVPPERRAAVVALYLQRFEDIAGLFNAPAGSHERKIGERLAAGTFFEVVPEWVRLIDNRQGFGYRHEWRL